ncbi:glycosyltransferase family 2 protein [Arthrobacter sp. C152]
MSLADPGGHPDSAAIERVAVVIPAHNEEQHLGRALAGVRAAADEVASRLPGVGVRVMVVLDSCTDASWALATDFAATDPRFATLAVDFRNVGMSRRAGAEALWPALGVPASRTWLANTDADSLVPGNWLVRQLELAARGADVVLGSVEPDGGEIHHTLAARWHARHLLAENHPYVHGANLGVRGSSYLAAGGFPGAASGEDRILVDRLRSSGAGIVATDSVRVLTSGRTVGRAPRGFAAYLLALAQQ